MNLFWPVLLIAGASLLAAVVRLPGQWKALWALFPGAAFAWVFFSWPDVVSGGQLMASIPWFEELGATVDLRLDAYGGLMAGLVTGVGTLIIVYAAGYMNGQPGASRLISFLLIFMAAMLGIVLADNLILLFVFWELTSITSYLLVGFNHEKEESRKKALQALLVTGTGGLALLAGLVLLGIEAGSWQISEIVAHGDVVMASPHLHGIIVLILLGASTKSAQFPFHFWLPNAMAAPTPVSALLHSATMVKAGVFIMGRFSPIFQGSEWWHGPVVIGGMVTLLVGAILGLFQTDLKKILAYTTLAVLGMLTMLIGFGSDLALKSMLVFLIGHALYKAALFMVAGGIDHGAGTRDVWKLGGLRSVMPFTMVAGALAAFSKAGFPPFLGFIGKEYVYKTGTSLDNFAPVFTGVMMLGNMLMFALALKVGWYPFWSKSKEAVLKGHPHEGSWLLWLPPLVLAVLGLVFGFMTKWTGDTLVIPALAEITGKGMHEHLALWHGITLPLVLSLVTFAGGVMIYRGREYFWRKHDQVENSPKVEHAYDRLLVGMVKFAKQQTRAIQGGSLSRYMFIVVGATASLLLWKFVRFQGWPELTWEGRLAPIPVIACIWIMVGAIVAAVAKGRLIALLAMGVVGLGITVLFVNFGAPDLAITQLLVDGLTVVLLLLVIYRLPPIRAEANRWIIRADATLAVFFGVLIGALTLSAMQIHVIERVGDTLAKMSYAEAYGRNVVNVILVDFRALDTFGEIIVLAIAAIGVTALLAAKKERSPDED